MNEDPFDPKEMQTESEFMQALAELIRKHRNRMDTSTMAGDLERCLAAVDEGMLISEFAPPPAPRGEAEVDIRRDAEVDRWAGLKLDDSRPVKAALDDRDHRIAMLEATVKELYARLK